MELGYLYLMGTLGCYTMLGVLHKMADTRHCRPVVINFLLFGWSAVFAYAALARQLGPAPAIPWEVWRIAVPSAACAALAVLTFQIGIRYGSLATSWLMLRVFGEQLNPRKGLALVAILVAILLVWKDKTLQERGR
jgi:predicted membrane channel-forming protein YqfA (hemolysin III family)